MVLLCKRSKSTDRDLADNTPGDNIVVNQDFTFRIVGASVAQEI